MSTSQFPPPHSCRQKRGPLDVVVIGAGPIGLAVAAELARDGLSVVVLERRGILTPAAGRPQLLVARPGDLSNLFHLGVDIDDPQVAAPLGRLCEEDITRGRIVDWAATPIATVPPRPRDPFSLAWQRPAALVPIARLQVALAGIAGERGVELCYGAHVTRVRRHARWASVEVKGMRPLRATLVVIATGAARAVASDYGVFRVHQRCNARTLIGGVFDRTASVGLWHRFEQSLAGIRGDVRCTLLATPTESDAGTALIVEAPRAGKALLPRCFDSVAAAHGLGNDMLVAPRTFETQVAAAESRFLSRDNRAPLVVVGDAAQTGHVFAGLTCFVNLWTALELIAALRDTGAIGAIAEARVGDPALIGALTRYDFESDRAADVLYRASQRHYRNGAWAASAAA